MKKIGILTTSAGQNGVFACNYGAALQGFALVRQLRLLGYDAYDLNYVSHLEYHPNSYSFLQRTLRRIPLLFNHQLIANKIKYYRYKKDYASLHHAFLDFIRKENLTYQNGRLYTIEQLQAEADNFYAFLCGSDVVWNPYLRQNQNDEGFFLNFVPDHVKRIAYAPSMGVTELPEESKANLKELLLKFDALSVREKSGSDLIRRETGIDVPVVLDPTMLLDPEEYKTIAVKPDGLPEHYIAVYKFGDVASTNQNIRRITEKLNLPIVFIPSGMELLGKARYDVGPGEFIGILQNADLVLSDSFHCTVFSLLCHTPFLTFYRTKPGAKGNINSRMTDLLGMVHMDDKMVPPDGEIPFRTLFACDFAQADRILAERRAESLAYLKNALEYDA